MQIIYLRYRLKEVQDRSSFHPEEDRDKIIEALEWIRSQIEQDPHSVSELR